MSTGVVIVGTGQAGVQAAFSLRDAGYEGPICLVGEEPDFPYQRPPLSKAFLLGKVDDDGLMLKGPLLYERYGVRRIDGVRVQEIDRSSRSVRLSSGERVAYEHLVLATGARRRHLGVEGESLDGVFTLRTLADARSLRERISSAKRAVVVGAGFIGLEFAAVARSLGIEVTVVELAARPLARALSTETAQFLHDQHVGWGTTFVLGKGVARFVGEGQVSGVELSDGTMLEADLVVVGIGVQPNAELAEAAALAVNDGVTVDELLRTSDPAIFAIGDCARHPNRFCGRPSARIESVQNATDQARCAAANIVGKTTAYDAVPWFWSDQGEIKLQIAGLGDEHDTTVVRGSPEARDFSVFCFRAGRLIAVESVNRGPDHVMARRLLAAGIALTPAEAADESRPLKSFLAPRP